MPKVSVVISTYNRHELLPRALKSIEKQTFRDFEVIIVDDGSNPPVKVNKEDYNFPIRLFRLRKNSGFHAKPKNYAISRSRAKYICYLDDDDEFKPDHIQVLVEAIESGDYDFAYGKRDYYKDGQYTKTSVFHPWKPETAHMGFWLGVPDILHTRKIIKELGGWNENLKRFGDFEFIARMGKIRAKGIAIDKSITIVHTHDGQLTWDPNRQGIDAREIVEKLKVKQSWLKKYKKTK